MNLNDFQLTIFHQKLCFNSINLTSLITTVADIHWYMNAYFLIFYNFLFHQSHQPEWCDEIWTWNICTFFPPCPRISVFNHKNVWGPVKSSLFFWLRSVNTKRLEIWKSNLDWILTISKFLLYFWTNFVLLPHKWRKYVEYLENCCLNYIF